MVNKLNASLFTFFFHFSHFLIWWAYRMWFKSGWKNLSKNSHPFTEKMFVQRCLHSALAFFIILARSSSPWENSSHSIHELNFHQNHMGRRYYCLKCLFSHFCKILHWSITITCRASNFFLAPQFSYFKCSTLWLSTYVLHIQRFHKTCQSSSFTYIFFCHLTCELRSSEEMLYTQ